MFNMKSLWLLGSGLLLAGTVEAGPNTGIPANENPQIVQCTAMDCPEGEHSLSVRTIEPVDRVCYERMREAMRMMRLTVDAAYRGSIVTATPQPSPTPKEIWDATMKECVQ